ncbi:MAG: hypothetical protein EOM03_08380 [Clostridia bacterium]|nr:hypothetical protein [Clostridia bacterium]
MVARVVVGRAVVLVVVGLGVGERVAEGMVVVVGAAVVVVGAAVVVVVGAAVVVVVVGGVVVVVGACITTEAFAELLKI